MHCQPAALREVRPECILEGGRKSGAEGAAVSSFKNKGPPPSHQKKCGWQGPRQFMGKRQFIQNQGPAPNKMEWNEMK